MSEQARLRVTNARIATEDPSMPEASAMVIEEEDIAWVGAEADMPASVRGPEDTVVDLGGARVIPGFIDAHMHAVTLANCAPKITVLPPAVNSIEDLVEAVRSRRQDLGPDEWIEGWGYDEALLAEGRSPTRWDLDRGCPDAPVCVTRVCEHIRCVNSRALEIAGITRDSPDPVGGEIERDENGEPTGVLKETARELVTPYLPKRSVEDAVGNILALGELLSSQGIVAATDMCSLDGSDIHPLLLAAAEQGLAQDVADFVLWDHVKGDPAFALSDEDMDRSGQVFCAGIKLLTDGSVSGKTAWFYEPFAKDGRPDPAGPCGMPTCTDADIADAIAFCKRTGCQISLHAMGTRAIDRAAEALSREEPWGAGSWPCARIEHVTAPSARAIELMASAGIGVATQPIFPYAEAKTYLANLGAERTRACYPLRTLLDRGVGLCLSTDAPATSWSPASDPFPTLKSAVTRTAADGTDLGQDEAISIEEAVALYTREAARVTGFERLGMLRQGYKASFVVLDRDIFSVPASEIDQVRVAATYIRGRRVFSA